MLSRWCGARIASGFICAMVYIGAKHGKIPQAKVHIVVMESGKKADYIDRQAAINVITEYADRLQMVNWQENPGVPYKAHTLNWCVNTIRDLPSADVQPVRHGHWIPKFGGEFKGGAYWYDCSKCGHTVVGGILSGNNFCKNCGADMRGRAERK